MKQWLLFVFGLCLLSSTHAQRDETLVSSSGRSGFFVASLVEFSDIQGESSTAVGGGMAFIAGDFFFGGYGLGVTRYSDLFDGDVDRLKMGHGGIWLGYAVPQHRVLHGFASLKIGWGGVNVTFDSNGVEAEESLFLLNPEGGLELNVFRWFRVAGAVGYRFVRGLEESTTFSNEDFSSMTWSLSFRLGGFGRARWRE